MAYYDLRRGRGWGKWLIAAVVAVLLGARTIASTVIEYQWWKEVGQVPVWTGMIAYGMAPVAFALQAMATGSRVPQSSFLVAMREKTV
jgi:hypothetical protein